MKLTDSSTSPVPQQNGEEQSAFLPIILFGLAALIFIGVSMKNQINRRSALSTAIAQRGQLVEQSRQVRAQLDRLATDLVKVSETDSEARAIVNKFRIQVVKKDG